MIWQRMPHPSHAPERFLFADISSNNASFDAQKYASAGHLLIGIKATQGRGFVNPDWSAWVRDAHANRLAVLHYHFVDGSGAVSEANHFWMTARQHFDASRDRLAIDFENPALARLGAAAPGYLAEFDHQLHHLSGIHAIGYTFRSALSAALRVDSGKWWVAAFGNQWPAGARRRLPSGTLWAWQFTDGEIGADGPRGAAGIGRCDVSVLSPPIVNLLRKTLRR